MSAFTSGDLAVFVAAASANNTTASVVELSPTTAGQTPSNTIAISGTGANAIRISGSAGTTGYLALSNDRSLLAFTGANSTNHLCRQCHARHNDRRPADRRQEPRTRRERPDDGSLTEHARQLRHYRRFQGRHSVL